MQHYVITFTEQHYGTTERYCYFSLPVKRARELIPLGLFNIDINEDVLYKISTKVFDEDISLKQYGTYRVVHNLRIKCEVDDWLKDIGAEHISYIKNTKGGEKDEVYICAIGSFGLEVSDINPKYKD
jgi:hypothetical protein